MDSVYKLFERMITSTKRTHYKGYTYIEEEGKYFLIRGFSKMPFETEIGVREHVEFLIVNR